MSRRASSNRGRRMRGGTGTETTANPLSSTPIAPEKAPNMFTKARRAVSKGVDSAKEYSGRGMVSAKDFGKGVHETLLTGAGWIGMPAIIIGISLSIILLYKYVPALYPVIPMLLVITMLCMGREHIMARRMKYVGTISLLFFFIAKISSSIGIGDGMFKKGWLDNNYCDEIKEDDT